MENVLCIIWVLLQGHRLLKRFSLLSKKKNQNKKNRCISKDDESYFSLFPGLEGVNIKTNEKALNYSTGIPYILYTYYKSYPRLFNLLECKLEQVGELVYCQHCHCLALGFNAFSNSYFLQEQHF